MSQKASIKGSELRGNAWAFASNGDARSVLQRLLAKPGLISDQRDSLLDTGFFAKRAVLVFLWKPSMDAELVAGVESLVALGGGNELEDHLKQVLLYQAQWRQVRRQRSALRSRRLRVGTTAHQPQGSTWTDVTP
jgi:hypothetical protein